MNQLVIRRIIRRILRKRRSKNDIYKIQGNYMYIDKNDSLMLSYYGIYEPKETKLIKNIVKPTFTVIDIGAHIGYYTLIMARKAKIVYAFEPNPYNFELLKRNIEINRLTNVRLYNKAVGNLNGKANLFISNLNSGMSRVYNSIYCEKEPLEIDMIRLDDIIDKVDFIKMDIEGSELGALNGMKKILENGVILLMEFHPPSIREYGADPAEIYNLLTNLGYKITLYNKDIPLDELINIASKIVGLNILCFKTDRVI